MADWSIDNHHQHNGMLAYSKLYFYENKRNPKFIAAENNVDFRYFIYLRYKNTMEPNNFNHSVH